MKVGIVETSDISIVVQGPIVSNSDVYPNGWTNEALRRMRIHFPGAEIILSTWKNSNVDELDYDVVIFNDDPLDGIPEKHRFLNINRQIVSTKSGLQKASRRYALKTRTDMIFNSNVILSYFDKYPERIENWKVFKERVITFVANNPRRYFKPSPFLIADFLHFGLKEDVISLWDVPLCPSEFATWFEFHPSLKHKYLYKDISFRYSPEQHIWINFLKKFSDNFGEITCSEIFDNTPENIYLTELIIANNLVLLDFKMLGLDHLKFVGNKESGKIDPKSNKKTLAHFSQDVLAYSHYEWNRLRKKYCLGETFYFPHIKYDILNPFFANLYIFLRHLKQSLKTLLS